MKLPATIFVFVGNEGLKNDEYLSAQATARGISDGTKVGIYSRTATRVQRVTEELVLPKRKRK